MDQRIQQVKDDIESLKKSERSNRNYPVDSRKLAFITAQGRKSEAEAEKTAQEKSAAGMAGYVLEPVGRIFGAASALTTAPQRAVGELIGTGDVLNRDVGPFTAAWEKLTTGKTHPGYEQPVGELLNLSQELAGKDAVLSPDVASVAIPTLEGVTDVAGVASMAIPHGIIKNRFMPAVDADSAAAAKTLGDAAAYDKYVKAEKKAGRWNADVNELPNQTHAATETLNPTEAKTQVPGTTPEVKSATPAEPQGQIAHGDTFEAQLTEATSNRPSREYPAQSPPTAETRGAIVPPERGFDVVSQTPPTGPEGVAGQFKGERTQKRTAERLAESDPFGVDGRTLYNQRSWLDAEKGLNAAAENRPEGTPPNRGVAAGDFDGFGIVNKKVGQAEGDKILIEGYSQAHDIAKRIDPTADVFRAGNGDEVRAIGDPTKSQAIADAWHREVRIKREGFDDITLSGGHGNTPVEADLKMQANKAARKAEGRPISVIPESPVSTTNGQGDMATRSVPKTMEKAGLTGAVDSPEGSTASGKGSETTFNTDTMYEVAHDADSVAKAKENIKDPKAALDIVKGETTKESVVTGLALAEAKVRAGDMSGAGEITDILAKKGTQSGQAVQAFSLTKQFDTGRALVRAQRELSAAKPGRKLSAEQITQVANDVKAREAAVKVQENHAAAIKELQTKYADLEARLNQQQGAKGAPKAKRGRLISDEALNAARENFKKALNPNQLGAGFDPTALKHAATIAAYHLETGIRSAAELSAKLIADLGEHIKPYVEDIMKAGHKLLREQRAERALETTSVIKPRTAMDEIGEMISKDNKAARAEALKKLAAEKKVIADKATERIIADKAAEKIKADEQKASEKEKLQEANQQAKAERQAMRDKEFARRTAEDAQHKIALEGAREEVAQRNSEARAAEKEQGRLAGNKKAAQDFKDAEAKRQIINEMREVKKNIAAAQKEHTNATKFADKMAGQLAKHLEQLTPGKRAGRIFGDTVSASRSVKTAYDLSAPGKQGFLFTVNHPFLSAKAFKEQILSLGDSAEKFKLREAKLQADPETKFWKEMGVDYTETSGSSKATHEEAFRSDLANKLPGVRRSEQAYSTYLNEQRTKVGTVYKKWFKIIQKMGIKVGEEDYRSVAQFINDGTGRGTQARPSSVLGRIERSPVTTQGAFAYRWVKSRFNLMNPVRYAKMPTAARLIAMKEMVQFVGATGLTMALAKKLGAEVDTDPDSPDFLKIRAGQQHYDISGGMQNPIRFMFRMTTAVKNQAEGQWEKRGDKWVDKDTGKEHEGASNIALDWLRTKAAPVPGMAIDVLTGETLERDAEGKKIKPTLKGELLNTVTPMVADDIYKTIKAEGGLTKSAIVGSTANFFGISTPSYKQKGRKISGKEVSPAVADAYDRATEARTQAGNVLEADPRYLKLTPEQKSFASRKLGGLFSGTTKEKELKSNALQIAANQRALAARINSILLQARVHKEEE